jgi:hypothetical protein
LRLQLVLTRQRRLVLLLLLLLVRLLVRLLLLHLLRLVLLLLRWRVHRVQCMTRLRQLLQLEVQQRLLLQRLHLCRILQVR